MTYVEWLRVRRVLKGTAITLGVLFLLAVVLRLVAAQIMPGGAAIAQMSAKPGTKIVSTVLPDGTKRQVMDNPSENVHIVIDDHGNGNKDVTISKPRGSGSSASVADSDDSVQVHSSHVGFPKDMNIPIDGFFEFAWLVGIIVASMLAVPFARENDGHLNIVWTKPIARERLALAIIGVDIVGILAAYVLALIVAAATVALFGMPHLTVTAESWFGLLGGIMIAIAWYACVNAASASMRRGYGAVLGFAWPVGLVVAVLSQVHFGDSSLGTTVHSVIWAISRIDPLTYADLKSSGVASAEIYYPIVAFLVVIYLASAIVQWRRVEA
jgi:hypothetical protein